MERKALTAEAHQRPRREFCPKPSPQKQSKHFSPLREKLLKRGSFIKEARRRRRSMPIFMDRHDLEHTTAADIAVAHQKDLEIQERYGVKFLTYWFDQQRGTVFCLMDAPDKATAHCVHQEAHGFVASEIVEVALSAVEAFLGRIQDPEPPAGRAAPDMDSGRRVVMFTDIVDSIVMTARLGDRLATELVRAHDAVVRRCLSRFGGREVKHLGDGIMASFRSTAQAIDCAAAIQADFDRYNRGNSEPIHVRI